MLLWYNDFFQKLKSKWPGSLGGGIVSRIIMPVAMLGIGTYQFVLSGSPGVPSGTHEDLSSLVQYFDNAAIYEKIAPNESMTACPGDSCPLNPVNFKNNFFDGWTKRSESIHRRASAKYWNHIYYAVLETKLPKFAAKSGSNVALNMTALYGVHWRLFVNGVEKATGKGGVLEKPILFVSDGGREGDPLLIGFEIDSGHSFDPGLNVTDNTFLSVPNVARTLRELNRVSVTLEVLPAAYGRLLVALIAAVGCFFAPFNRATIFFALGTGWWSYIALYRNGVISNFESLQIEHVTVRTVMFCLSYAAIFGFVTAFLRRPRKHTIAVASGFCVLAVMVYWAGRTGYGRGLVPFLLRHHNLILASADFTGLLLCASALKSTLRNPHAKLRSFLLLCSLVSFAFCTVAEILLQGWVWQLDWTPFVGSYEKRQWLRGMCEHVMIFFGVAIASEWAVMSNDRQKVLKRFAMFVDRKSIKKLLRTKDIPSVAAEKLVVLFVDLRGFTKLCGSVSPQYAITALNEYLDVVTTAVESNHGSVDKFVGDEVMALWGMEEQSGEDPINCVRAALEIRRAMNVLNERRIAQGDVALRCGIGIHCGPAIIGPVGNSQRIDYTAIGPAVNLAARLQSLTKDKRFDILMSQDLANEVKHLVLAQDLGLNKVRGFDNDIHVLGLLGAVDSNGEMKIEDPVLEAKLAGRGPGICHDAPENLLDVA